MAFLWPLRVVSPGSGAGRRGGAGCVGIGRSAIGLRRGFALLAALAMGGCATVIKQRGGVDESMPKEAAAVATGPVATVEGGVGAEKAPPAVAGGVPKPAKAPETVAAPAVPLPERPPEGLAWLWVDSEPAGMMVVVDGVPVGRTPRRVELEVTPQGFARHPATIRVRFVAESAQQTSVTTELVLTPRDRVPAQVQFTRERVLRRQ